MSDEFILKISVIGSNTNLNYEFGNLTADNRLEINYLPTLGHDLPTKSIKIENRRIKLIIQILAGEDFFFELRTKSYYRGSTGCLILFDKGNLESFDAVERFYREFHKALDKSREFYLRHFGLDVESLPITLVGIKGESEKVTTEQGQTLAEKLNMAYYETLIIDKQQISTILKDLTKRYLNLRYSGRSGSS